MKQLATAALHTGRAPEIRSRPYVWTATETIKARATANIARVRALPTPDYAKDALIGWYEAQACRDLIWLATHGTTARPVHLIPSARTAA